MIRPIRSAVLMSALSLSLLAPGPGAFGSGAADPNALSSTYQPVPSVQLHELASVPVTTLKAIGRGTAAHAKTSEPQLIHATTLTQDGKRRVVFVDAEFCPFCATVRWGLTVALDRFGRFKGITTMHSSDTDVDPSTQTLSFRYATYQSKWFAFDPIVNEDLEMHQVTKPPKKIKALWDKYTGTGAGPGYPFVYFGGRAVLTDDPVDPAVLKGLTRPQIAGDLADPQSKVAKAIDGMTNEFTAALCRVTDNEPKRVCHVTWIKDVGKTFGKWHQRTT